MPNLEHISEGNTKTACYSFDIPAKITCPGMTSTCGDKCYAANLMRAYPAVDGKYARNLEFANGKNFVNHMVNNIPYGCQFRIHVSGDFYSIAYIEKWRRICSERPDVEFYTYTRSWRMPDLWWHLDELGQLDNVTINLSVDRDTGAPDCYNAQGYRWTYLTHDDEVCDWIRSDDIVFRSAHIGQKKKRKNDRKKGIDPDIRAPLVHRLSEGIVCPFERGRDMPEDFSCAKCRLCIDKLEVPCV